MFKALFQAAIVKRVWRSKNFLVRVAEMKSHLEILHFHQSTGTLQV